MKPLTFCNINTFYIFVLENMKKKMDDLEMEIVESVQYT